MTTYTLPQNDGSIDSERSEQAIGLLGGTFDPVHNAHLHYAQQIAEHLALKKIHLMPANVPPHKSMNVSSAEHRKAMIDIVCQHNKLFYLNEFELGRNETSFTVKTLEMLAQNHQGPIYFFIGMDSLCQLDKWYKWEELLNYCHLVVTGRPGYELPSKNTQFGRYIHQHLTTDKAKLKSQRNGFIYKVITDNLEISSTSIRSRINNGLTCQYLVPEPVLDYIRKHRLYR